MTASIRMSLRLILSCWVFVLFSACASSRQPSNGEQADQQEDDQVNVGYGTQDKDDVTGSISSVTDEEIDQNPSVNLQQLLVSRVPGVYLSEAPGGGIKVNIRGQNSLMGSSDPLFVVDGMAVSNATGGILTTVNPSDIKSIEVLKDASSTAIYGSRGANGVILITTKRGGDR